MRPMCAHDITIGTGLPAGLEPWLPVVAAMWIAVAAGLGYRRLRGTTLAAPAVWAVASGLAIVAVETYLSWRGNGVSPLAASLWRYSAAVGTFCPLMAVLGAKRPQDRGWQWVVLSLWVILLVPAVHTVTSSSGARFELFAAWQLLIGSLIGMGLLNYLPTRYAAAALLFAIGQSLLLKPYKFDVSNELLDHQTGIIGISAAAAYVHGSSKVRRDSAIDGERNGLRLSFFNARWFAFRDGWGAFWGLRVMQRVNQTAELSGWPVRLEWWEGFTPMDETLDAQTAAHIQQTLDSLLWRFERR